VVAELANVKMFFHLDKSSARATGKNRYCKLQLGNFY